MNRLAENRIKQNVGRRRQGKSDLLLNVIHRDQIQVGVVFARIKILNEGSRQPHIIGLSVIHRI